MNKKKMYNISKEVKLAYPKIHNIRLWPRRPHPTIKGLFYRDKKASANILAEWVNDAKGTLQLRIYFKKKMIIQGLEYEVFEIIPLAKDKMFRLLKHIDKLQPIKVTPSTNKYVKVWKPWHKYLNKHNRIYRKLSRSPQNI